MALNRALETELAGRGMIFNPVNTAGFRARLAGGFYAGCRERCGASAWRLLEEAVGRLPA